MARISEKVEACPRRTLNFLRYHEFYDQQREKGNKGGYGGGNFLIVPRTEREAFFGCRLGETDKVHDTRTTTHENDPRRPTTMMIMMKTRF
jgi:hypothetical protein